jgi:hypothetical protein
MTQASEHQDAERLERAAAGLPVDVHDPVLEAAYEAQRKLSVKTKASPKPTPKAGKGS